MAGWHNTSKQHRKHKNSEQPGPEMNVAMLLFQWHMIWRHLGDKPLKTTERKDQMVTLWVSFWRTASRVEEVGRHTPNGGSRNPLVWSAPRLRKEERELGRASIFLCFLTVLSIESDSPSWWHSIITSSPRWSVTPSTTAGINPQAASCHVFFHCKKKND